MMPQALGAAHVKRLGDRREPERLAGVDRDVEVVAHHAREGVQVARGRVARLGAGDVEAADPLVAVAQRQLGDLEAAGLLPHGRAEHPHGQLAARGAALEAGQDRLDDLVELEPGPDVQLGGEADLGVDDPVVGEVLGALGGHPLQRLARLHDRHRVGERLQVEDEVVPVGAVRDHLAQLLGVARGQAAVARLAGQLDNRPRAQAAVEVVVQQDLGGADDVAGVELHA